MARFRAARAPVVQVQAEPVSTPSAQPAATPAASLSADDDKAITALASSLNVDPKAVRSAVTVSA